MGTEISSLKSDLGSKIFREYWNLGIRGAQTFTSGTVCGLTSLIGFFGTYVMIAPSENPIQSEAPLLTGMILVAGVGFGALTWFLGKITREKYKWLGQKFEGENILNYFHEDLEKRGQKIEFVESNGNLEKKISLTLPATDILLINGFEKYDNDNGLPSFRQTRNRSPAQSSFLNRSEDLQKEICYRILKPYSLLDEKNWESYHKVIKTKIIENNTGILKTVVICDEIYKLLKKGDGKIKDYSDAFNVICIGHRMNEEKDYDKNLLSIE